MQETTILLDPLLFRKYHLQIQMEKSISFPAVYDFVHFTSALMVQSGIVECFGSKSQVPFPAMIANLCILFNLMIHSITNRPRKDRSSRSLVNQGS